MNLQKYFFFFVWLYSTFLLSCTPWAYISSPSNTSEIPSPLPYTYIPIHCEESKIPDTLKIIESITSGSVIEINIQADCKYWLDILEIPKPIRTAISKGQYKAVILGDDSGMGPNASFTPDEWHWLKDLDTQLFIDRQVSLTFPGLSRTADYKTLFEILPILETGTPKKYTNMIEYSKQFPESLTQENIQKCDSLVPGSISYSWAQALYQSPKEDKYPAEMKWFRDRADCYTKVIR